MKVHSSELKSTIIFFLVKHNSLCIDRTLSFTELKPEMLTSSLCQPSTSRRVGVKSEPLENTDSGAERDNPSKRVCDIKNQALCM